MIIALSGGADSVVLLHKLLHAGHQCIAAHCNFHLRGEESTRDEQFVGNLCAKWSVELHIKHFDTLIEAKSHGVSVEMAAREERYQWFEELRQQLGADFIAVGHHQNDAAETVLLNLKRGTGLRGLQGIKILNGYIYRPLLSMTRKEIEDYAAINHLSYVTDSTNMNVQFSRNRIRAELRGYSDTEIKHIAQTCEYVQDYLVWINEMVKAWRRAHVMEEKGMQKISIAPLLAHPSPKVLLFELLREYNFHTGIISEILHSLIGETGKCFYSSTHVAVKDRAYLLIYSMDASEEPSLNVHYAIRAKKNMPKFPMANEKEACLSERVLNGKLVLRHPQDGDLFIPYGMRGKKKIMDFLAEQRVPVYEKKNVWLLTCNEDIVWVIGYRIDDRYKVLPQDENLVFVQVK